jgi:hypothetical protein
MTDSQSTTGQEATITRIFAAPRDRLAEYLGRT